MKGKIYFTFFLCLFLAGFISAEIPNYQQNYTVLPTSGGSNVQITNLRYEPYPVSPGEYFTIYFEAQKTGSQLKDVSFELQQDYPFSLDNPKDAVKTFTSLTSDPVVLQYKVRVADNAVSGVNTLTLVEQESDGSKIEHKFDINVEDVQTAFDAVIQENSNGALSIAIANIGNNNALSTIVRVPTQDGIKVSNTNAQMIGNLAQGDYTVVGFTLSQMRSSTLNLQVDYTDAIGKRRSEIIGIELATGSTNSTLGSYAGAKRNSTLTGTSSATSNSYMTYLILGLIILFLVIIIWKIYKYKKNKTRKSSSLPEWLKKEKESKK